jgi:hypothetical protein
VARGLELAPMTNDVERDLIQTKAGSDTVFVGVRMNGNSCDWNFLGSNYVKGCDPNKNSEWCAGEPNNSGGNEHCLEFKAGSCWNDMSCGTSRKFICGLPVCKREQVISIGT